MADTIFQDCAITGANDLNSTTMQYWQNRQRRRSCTSFLIVMNLRCVKVSNATSSISQVDLETPARHYLLEYDGCSKQCIIAVKYSFPRFPRPGTFVPRLSSNNGFDGVFVKYDTDGVSPLDIIINESKFTSTGKASLSNTNMGRQMSPSWIDANIQKMMNSSNPTIMENGFFLDVNRDLIRTKINVLNPQGVNGWSVLKAPK
ncbi:MAG: hypothetical protein ABUS47_11650 [Steroidobacter sp.]